MNPTPLTYLDGETLMSTVLPPLRFVVGKLLPQGLHILAAASFSPGRSRSKTWISSPGKGVW